MRQYFNPFLGYSWLYTFSNEQLTMELGRSHRSMVAGHAMVVNFVSEVVPSAMCMLPLDQHKKHTQSMVESTPTPKLLNLIRSCDNFMTTIDMIEVELFFSWAIDMVLESAN
ncbi:hypothetical protein M758_12G055200 [Ceratodon purpureus]|nr:hypothetical protein M758_12G055200 [Ceratodon purpureus]